MDGRVRQADEQKISSTEQPYNKANQPIKQHGTAKQTKTPRRERQPRMNGV
jgi:hypothetical protein